jgi:hypothetical protein
MATSFTASEVSFEIARRKFERFLDYVRVQNTDMDDSPEMVFQKWPHLLYSARLMSMHRLLVFLKARQIGITWLMAAYALWTALFHPGAVVLILSKGEGEAKVFLRRIKFIYQYLPPGLQFLVTVDSATELAFENGAKIQALPATEDAGRSETATLVIQDEADYHKHLEANFAAVRPTIDGGGQHIMASTSNFETQDSFFKLSYLRANSVDEDTLESKRDGVSRYIKVFLSWRVRPDRDETWRDQITADYEEDRRDKEYPETEAQALAPPKAIAAFDHHILDDMMNDTRAPLNVAGYPPDARIFQKFSPGKKYAAFTDSSHGSGKDYAVTVIGDCATGMIVADIYSQLLEPDELANQSVRLLDTYDSPIWGIEDNDWGIAVIKAAQRMGYKNLYHRPLSASKPHSKGQVGWHTDERSRYILYGDLRQAIKERLLTIPAEDGLRQFYDTIRNPNKNGRVEAVQGRHDDYPLAVGGFWQMRGHARRSRGVSTIERTEEGYRLVPSEDLRRTYPSASVGQRW